MSGFSLASVFRFVLSSPQVLFGPASFTETLPKQCPNPQLSCHNSSAVEGSCCFSTPGGQILQTQFWDSRPSLGPEDSWTIHGLWPDNCDGTYESYCDHQRIYKNITQILEEEGSRGDILLFMGEYWKDLRGHDESLYEHEWSKHGTCINTLDPKCYPDYRAQEEVVTYFEKTVELFKTLPSYTWLSDAGITPSHSKVYDLTAIQNALQKGFGRPVTVKCHRGELDEIWYHFNVKGSFNTGKDGGIQNFVPSDPDGIKSTCPKHVKYIPKLPKNL